MPKQGLVSQSRRSVAVVGTAAMVAWSCASAPSRVDERLPAESHWIAPARPSLPVEADTNDAAAYLSFGTATIGSAPETAAAAFYWATRLDPWAADAYYARAVALRLSLMELRAGTNVWVQKRNIRQQERTVIDSLDHVAHTLNPFIDRRYDHLFGPPVVFLICGRVLAVREEGMCLLHKGQHVRAVRRFADALKAHPEDIDLHYLRAQLFYRLSQFDSAAVQLRILGDSMENRQMKRMTVYVSRATILYAEGRANAEHGDSAAARQAYERALAEDLAFYMASVRLAGHALATRDTAAALRHFAHAITVQPADAPLRFYYGVILSNRNQRREAAEQYMRAIEINPYYAPPYVHLGRLLERSDRENAVTAYHMYLGRAARGDSTRAWVLERLQALVRSP